MPKLEDSPYVGPQPFERKDRNLFYGRDFEAMEIISIILSNPITLIYSQSGVGKTSLFNTKILFDLEEEHNFTTFPSARVRGLLSPDKIPKNINNIYMFNALLSLDPRGSPEKLKTQTLSDFLKHIIEESKKENSSTPRLIVFDQLEELFGLYPENWMEQQQEFFQQIEEAINQDEKLRIVLVIREEYLAQLSSFANLVPGRLKARFRLERLKRESALLAVNEPMKQTSKCRFGPGVAEKLVDDLLTMRIENIFGKIVDMRGEYVEPVHLQVVCQRLWMKARSSGLTEITQEYLKDFGNVNQALTEFYLDTISYAAKQGDIKKDKIRNWFDKRLITSSGTRGIVHREASSTGGLPNNVVDILQQRYLIRQEWRSGSRWYELTHDRLIAPILESNKEWYQKKKVKKIIISTISTASAVAVILVLTYAMFMPTSPQPLIIDQRIVPVGESPGGVAVNPTTNTVYVANYDSNTVSVIDGKTNTVTDTVSVGESPGGVAVNPTTNTIYVANFDPNTVSVIDGKTNTVTDTVPVGSGPEGVAVNPTTNTIYVTNYADNTISAITGRNYVANSDSNPISVKDSKTNKVMAVLVGESPYGVAVNPTTNTIYVTNDLDSTTSVIDGKTNTVTDTVSVGESPDGVAVNPTTNTIYVANYDPNTVSVISGKTNNVTDTVSVGESPQGVAVNPTTNTIYVANYDSNTISVLINRNNLALGVDNKNIQLYPSK